MTDELGPEQTLILALKNFFFSEKAAYKMEHGLNFSANDYAYVEDPDRPASWKVRLAESPGKVTKQQLDKAANELVGNQVNVPINSLSAVKRRIRAEYRKLGATEAEIPVTVKSSFSISKQADGSYRWMAIFSNNFRDDDKPSEIISSKSHQIFSQLVKEKIVEPPELWVWHISGSRFGVADYVDVVKEGNATFSIAVGTIDPGMEAKAERLSDMDDVAMSHGMPIRFIKRDPVYPSIITRHITQEISVLPRWAAANKFTGFVIKESNNMALTDNQKEFLASVGFDDSEVAALDGNVKNMAAAAEGREFKETTTEPETEPSTPEPVQQTDESTDENLPIVDLQKEIADALIEVIGPITSMIKAQNKAIADMQSTIAELKASDKEKVAKAAASTPQLSLKELVAQALIGQSNEAVIDGRSSLAKDKPREAPVANVTGIPFLDKMMAGVED